VSGLIAALAFWGSLLAVPVTIACVVDDWFLRPRRQLRAPPGQLPPDPPLMRALYAVLPVLLIASFYRLVTVENADFSLVFVLLSALSGLVRLIDRLWLRRGREAAARAAGRDPAQLEVPGTVDYARSFFPVLTVLLVLRSFLYEPYRIPSDSMMPTLLDGDFILVNKHAYGLRWPVTNKKFLDIGGPRRGDVAVFRYPPDPKVNYVKRLVGLPGDLVEVRDDQLIINGEPVPLVSKGRYADGCYLNMRISEETLDGRTHQVLHCPSADYLTVPPLSACERDIPYGYLCNEASAGVSPDLGDKVLRVPEGKYLMVGDNRDNSADGRVWGFVDESQLVGRASAIWFNWDLQRSGGPKWSRIGTRIE
jgi:signal peptidase I